MGPGLLRASVFPAAQWEQPQGPGEAWRGHRVRGLGKGPPLKGSVDLSAVAVPDGRLVETGALWLLTRLSPGPASLPQRSLCVREGGGRSDWQQSCRPRQPEVCVSRTAGTRAASLGMRCEPVCPRECGGGTRVCVLVAQLLSIRVPVPAPASPVNQAQEPPRTECPAAGCPDVPIPAHCGRELCTREMAAP